MLDHAQNGHHRNVLVSRQQHVYLVVHPEVVRAGGDGLKNGRGVGRRVHGYVQPLVLEVALTLGYV